MKNIVLILLIFFSVSSTYCQAINSNDSLVIDKNKKSIFKMSETFNEFKKTLEADENQSFSRETQFDILSYSAITIEYWEILLNFFEYRLNEYWKLKDELDSIKKELIEIKKLIQNE